MFSNTSWIVTLSSMHFDGGVSMRSLVEKSRLEVVGSCNVVVF